tara:strand:- start:72 stop:410 length:339 start_codon:yes stop_codon:yes gene_type:complete
MKKKIFCFDIDGVICKTQNRKYKNSRPIKKNINFINKLYDEGNYIKLFTSRYMGRFNEDVKKAKKVGFKLTEKQMLNWKIKYHKLILGKPSYDYFIDDKAFNSIEDYFSKKK